MTHVQRSRKLPITGWPFPTDPIYRVAVRRRRPHGAHDLIDIARTRRCWSWWCSCDRDPHHATDQQTALIRGLAHLADSHDERPLRRR